MGNKATRRVKQDSDSLPPPPTVNPLHQELLREASALHSGYKNPLRLYQISDIISRFLPPTTALTTKNLIHFFDFLFQFPAAVNELRITAIEVGEITNSKLTPGKAVHSGYYEKKQFHVKLIFDETKFDLRFPPIPNMNSFHYKPNSMEFDIFQKIKSGKRTWSKSYNVVLGDLVVTKPRASSSPQAGASSSTTSTSTTTSSAAASSKENEVIQMFPMRNDFFVGDTCWYETVPASRFLQYVSTRLCSVDFSNVQHMLEIPQVPITVTVRPYALRSTGNYDWSFSCIRLELSEQITVLMDGIKFSSHRMSCSANSCLFHIVVVEPEVQRLSLQLYKQQGSASTVKLTICMPMDRLYYVRRHAPMLPIIPQVMKVTPPKSLGATTFSNQGQLPVVSMKLPRFFQQYCFVQLVTNFTVEPRDTLVMQDSYLDAQVSHKIDFLNVNFRKLTEVTPSELSLSLKRDGLHGQDPEVFCFFHAENLTEEALNQESTRGPKKLTGRINLGQMLLDQFSFFVWKNRNEHVTAKKLNELREYTIISVSSNVSFTKCVFEITMEICKNFQPNAKSKLITTMTMLLDLNKMVATISEKMLGIELEFGLRSADALSRLQSLLYDAATKSSQFLDISLCFESTATICEVETS